MEPITFFLVYIVIFVACILITLGIIRLLKPGVKKYFESLFQDHDVTDFFSRLVSIVLLLGGLSAALVSPYKLDEKSNWLTLSWDATGQFRSTLSNLYDGLMALTIVFLILHVINRILVK